MRTLAPFRSLTSELASFNVPASANSAPDNLSDTIAANWPGLSAMAMSARLFLLNRGWRVSPFGEKTTSRGRADPNVVPSSEISLAFSLLERPNASTMAS